MTLRKTPFIIFLSLIFIINLIHLNKVPIAWIDEVMLIDPAWNLIDKGSFAGKVWPHQGAEDIFLAYLPLSSFIHLIDLSIFPKALFFTRLPWLLFYITLCVFVYHYIRARYLHLAPVILIFLCLFVCDEAINHSLRNGRVEMPAMAIMAVLFYLHIRAKRPSVQAILISLLLISHPGFYPIALVFIVSLLSRKASPAKRLQYLLSIALFPMIYLYMAGFSFNAIYEQLILHGREHDSSAIAGNHLSLHFFGRFWPVYKFQPWMIGLNILCHLYCLYSIIMRWNPRQQALEWAFLLTSLFWLFSLAPFNRYTSVLSMMMFMMLPGLIQRLLSIFGFLRVNTSRLKPIHLAILITGIGIAFAPFAVRHFSVAQQWQARNEYKVYQWLDTKLGDTGNQKILITGEAIAFYYSMNHSNVDFTLPQALHKYNIADYDKVYCLAFGEIPESLELIENYNVDDALKHALSHQKIYTYNQLGLYLVPNEESLKKLYRK